jgi:hypothetical protein
VSRRSCSSSTRDVDDPVAVRLPTRLGSMPGRRPRRATSLRSRRAPAIDRGRDAVGDLDSRSPRLVVDVLVRVDRRERRGSGMSLCCTSQSAAPAASSGVVPAFECRDQQRLTECRVLLPMEAVGHRGSLRDLLAGDCGPRDFGSGDGERGATGVPLPLDTARRADGHVDAVTGAARSSSDSPPQ